MSGYTNVLQDVTCYYCNQVMSESYLQTHLTQCDLVVEKCANGCGATIQRRYKALHQKNECSRRGPQQRTREIPVTQDNLGSEIMKLRSALMEERRLRHVAVDEWRQKYDSMEAWNKKLVGVLAAFKQTLHEEQQQRQQESAEWRLEVETMRKRWQHVDTNWRGDILAEVQILRQALTDERQQRERLESEYSSEMSRLRHVSTPQSVDYSWRNDILREIQVLHQDLYDERQIRERLHSEYSDELSKLRLLSSEFENELRQRSLEGRSSDMENLLKSIQEERQHRQRIEAEWAERYERLEQLYLKFSQWKLDYGAEVQEVKDMFAKEQGKRDQDIQQCKAIVAELPQRCLAEDHLNKELDELRTVLEEYKSKIEKVTEQCKKDVSDFKDFLSKENVMISGVWVDQLKKIEDLKKDLDGKVAEMMKSVALQQLQLKDVEDSLLKREDYLFTTAQKPGRMLWRLTEYAKKMVDAKENDTSLHSPVFYSSQYGYKLRLEVKLNGLGQWKGRHMIVSLQVLEGEWDPLLPWPLSLKVSITLRDQVRNREEANDLVKNLTVGRSKEDPSGLHLFIPHKTMEQHNYIREDCIFLEAVVS